MDPQISVVIITLNEEHYLPNLLSCLAKQTDKNFDVVVVDAKSTDKTKEKALGFKDRLNLQFIESAKGQVSYQRNLGAKYAKSDYFFFLDADALITPNAIEVIYKHIQKGHKPLYMPTIIPGVDTLDYRIVFSISVSIVKLLHKLNRPLSFGPFFVIHKDLFTKLHGFDEHVLLAEDHNIVIRANKLGIKPEFIEDTHVIYSIRRFEQKGKWNIIKDYAYYSLITLLKGGVYINNKNYTMGGQEYKR